MADPRVLAVLVAHASGSRLGEALASIAAQTYRPLGLVVAAVGEVTVPEEQAGARLRGVVRVEAGTGFSAAVTRALAATEGSDPYLLLLHDDVELDPEAVGRLVARAESGADVAACGVKLVEWDEPGILQEVGGSIDRFGSRRLGLEPHEVDHGQHDAVDDVLFCSSACLLVRRDAFDRAGGLDPDAWPMYEDIDLCWRLRASGERVVVEPAARARHAAALSRGLRRSAGPSFGALGIRAQAERGRLRFMLKNYETASLVALLPQYVVIAAATVIGGLARREFWRIRTLVRAWGQVLRELRRISAGRRRTQPRRVSDGELLELASRRTAATRRFERVAVAAAATDALARAERRFGRLAREPVVWAGVVGAIVVAVALRGVLFAGPFTLGELRPLPSLGAAVRAYLAQVRPEGLDPFATGGPGVLVLGALRSVLLGRVALAEKALLVVPLLTAAFGAARVGRALGLERTGRRWLVVGAAVNPATLALVRGGRVGALVTWGMTMWVAAAILAPPGPQARLDEQLRRRSRWILAWAVVVALHPPALVWLAAVGLAVVWGRGGDGRGGRRRALVALGPAGAFVLGLPWSIDWFGAHTTLVGLPVGLLRRGGGGLDAATFGAGWPLLALVAAAIAAAVAGGRSRLRIGFGALAGAGWLAGAIGLLAPPTALVAVVWAALATIASSGRDLRVVLSQRVLGWRHGAALASLVLVAAAWSVSIGTAVRDGTETRAPIAVGARTQTGRVLWVMPAGSDRIVWATDGFRQTIGEWPTPRGPEERLVSRALDAARDRRTHRLGAVLALADISHVVVFGPQAARGLDGQTDLAPQESQRRTTIYRNEAWQGRAFALLGPPTRVLSAGGLAALSRERSPIGAVVRGAGIRLDVPPSTGGVVYLAVGARTGWRVGDAAARPASAGVWVPADGLPSSAHARAPGSWRNALRPLVALIALAFACLWVVSVYAAGPETARDVPVPPSSDAAGVGPPRAAGLVPIAVAAGAAALAWIGPSYAAAPPFLSSVWYCPPVAPTGEGFGQQIAIANPSESAVRYQVRPNLTQPVSKAGPIPGHGRVTVDADPRAGAVVEAYGRRLAVGSLVSGQSGAGASPCSPQASETWLFPEGGRRATGSTRGLREGFILYNPFPELARASVRFYTDEETISPPALQDVRIDAGTARLLDPESQLEPQAVLGAELTIWQGRAISARRLRGGGLLDWSLGSPLTASGVLPRAATKEAATSLVAINPSGEPARVTMTMTGDEGSLPTLSFDVSPRGRGVFELDEPAPDQRALVVRVSSTPPVALEGVVVPDTRTGISLLPPLEPSSRWAIPAVEGRVLQLTNPGSRDVRVRITRLGPGPSTRPVRIRAAATVLVGLEGSEPSGALLESDGGPIVVAGVGGPSAVSAVSL